MKTFPKLYTIHSVSEISSLVSATDKQERIVPESEEYKPMEKKKPDFSWELYKKDSKESNKGSSEGFYITAVAEKVEKKK
tara:strand:- start:254 stop:493 length:240 start_codon:yes stop_codon:yes gene_type:complete